jgi:hypothetical protein
LATLFGFQIHEMSAYEAILDQKDRTHQKTKQLSFSAHQTLSLLKPFGQRAGFIGRRRAAVDLRDVGAVGPQLWDGRLGVQTWDLTGVLVTSWDLMGSNGYLPSVI